MFVASTFTTFGSGVEELDSKNSSLSTSGTKNNNKWNFTSTVTTHLHSLLCIENDIFVQEKQMEDHI